MEKEAYKTQFNSSKSPLIKISLKLRDKNGTTLTYRSSKTKRILSIIKAENFLEAPLSVTYQKPFSNFGIYKTKEDLIFALRAFTEKSLVDYIRS